MSSESSPSETERPPPTTPRKPRNRIPPETPAAKIRASPGDAPHSAPAAAQGGRRHDSKKQHEATLLSDFFHGRQTAARVAADRKRRQSVDAVKAELRANMRQEMRQNSVRKLQQPGGVRERVQVWQRTHGATMATSDPNYAATEPDDVAFDGEDLESVTEDDRMRIKMRLRSNARAPKFVPNTPNREDKPGSSAKEDATEDETRSLSPPKKRVVSDSNWMRQKPKKSPSRKVSPSSSKEPTPQTSKAFVLNPTPNPPVSSKIKAWAAKIEMPDEYESGSQVGSAASRSTARLKPKYKQYGDDDGIRVAGSDDSSSVRDDGIRVRPTATGSNISFSGQTYRPPASRRSKSIADSSRSALSIEPSDVSSPSSEGTKKPVRRRSKSMSADKKDSVNYTPTKTRPKRSETRKKTAASSYLSATTAETDASSNLGDEGSNLSSSLRPDSDLDSKVTSKTLADIPGDIPFGHSAFSELDLSGKYRPKKLNVDRKSSFKGVPHVFKKVVEEGKKIMKDMNEPPRPQAPNKPPSIEKWLSTTVDPFVETPKEVPAPTIKKQPSSDESVTTQNSGDSKTSMTSLEKEAPAESSVAASSKDLASTVEDAEKLTRSETVRRRRHTVGAHKRHSQRGDRPERASDVSTDVTDETATPVEEKNEHKEQAEDDAKKGKIPMELKRTRAKRATSSPLRNREGFLGMFKNAFSGESVPFAGPGKTPRAEEPRRHELYDQDYSDDYTAGSALSSRDTESQLTESTASGYHANTPKMAAPRHPPPTKGNHELSTIMSDDGSSAVSSALTGSDATSRVTQSTGTQSSIMSKSSHPSLKKRHSSSKRRVTSHSDLMSVLSLPDQAAVPQGIKNRSRPSLRRKQGVPAGFSEYELLQEFEDDEHLYNRELKTLVDGVIPVLLSDVVSNSDATTLFSTGGGSQADAISKAVVGMGVALEKLKNAHRKAPLQDIRRLAHWAHGVVPMYNSYLGAWRLGFQDLVVNLAPAAGQLEEDDSLLDALPRNEHGDIINENGERVAVGYLLKRPLVRIKHMTKLIKCIDSIINSQDTNQLLRDFENLQEKSRRRHREETARIEDEDAINTDITRCRDIRTLGAVTPPIINPHLQVNAKDTFSLSLAHSNGQRLQCRVELVYRDNPLQPKQPGDLLIREPGDGKEGRKSYLLFPPIPMLLCSARTGEGHFDMVIMLQGVYQDRSWHELLSLTADDEDQVLDWLDLLPLNPVPPREPEPSVVGDDEPDNARDVPVGVARPAAPRDTRVPSASVSAARAQSPLINTAQDPQTPPRQKADVGRDEVQPLPTPESDQDKTPTQPQPTYNVVDWDDGNRQEEEQLLPQPLKIKKASPPRTLREDGAPPPPAHRTLPPTLDQHQKDPNLLAPPEPTERVKRRRSSPLKHEYLPSDASSGGSSSPSPEHSDDDSSDDDDIDSMDIPETELGVSISKEAHQPSHTAPNSALSQSDCSVTPSNSASQACGVYPPRSTTEQQDNTTRYMASLSRWSDKGAWKDLSQHPCAIVVSAGLVEAYAFRPGSGQGKSIRLDEQPLIALDLTPLVLIRQSTALDLEVRSSVQMHSRLYEKCNGGNFRFRCHSAPECFALYMAVHQARLSNQKFIQLENEARFRGFGERHETEEDDRAGRRRSWFGRKNSYRSSPRSAARSQDGESAAHSSTPSATSFLKRLTQSGNAAFNLEHSSIDRQSRGGSGRNSLYTSGSSSASGASPRSPSVSTGNGPGMRGPMDSENIRVRLHLLVSSTKWEDCGNCILKIRRPPPGWHQALLADHGLEKRITVETQTKKDDEEPKVLLDAVLGSGCFSAMGSRGIVCGIWEEVQGADGVVGMIPAKANPGGKIKKWCFQLSTAAEANWVLRMVHQEVVRA